MRIKSNREVITVREFLESADKRTRKYHLIRKYVEELDTDLDQDVEILWDHILDVMD